MSWGLRVSVGGSWSPVGSFVGLFVFLGAPLGVSLGVCWVPWVRFGSTWAILGVLTGCVGSLGRRLDVPGRPRGCVAGLWLLLAVFVGVSSGVSWIWSPSLITSHFPYHNRTISQISRPGRLLGQIP